MSVTEIWSNCVYIFKYTNFPKQFDFFIDFFDNLSLTSSTHTGESYLLSNSYPKLFSLFNYLKYISYKNVVFFTNRINFMCANINSVTADVNYIELYTTILFPSVVIV